MYASHRQDSDIPQPTTCVLALYLMAKPGLMAKCPPVRPQVTGLSLVTNPSPSPGGGGRGGEGRGGHPTLSVSEIHNTYRYNCVSICVYIKKRSNLLIYLISMFFQVERCSSVLRAFHSWCDESLDRSLMVDSLRLFISPSSKGM